MEEKTAIAAACERFIGDTLKPRFLPEVRPTQFNYPIDIFRQMARKPIQLHHALPVRVSG
jgi:hypothetical protein